MDSSVMNGGYVNGKRSSGISGPRPEPEPLLSKQFSRPPRRQPVARKPVAVSENSPVFDVSLGTAISSETDLATHVSSLSSVSPVSTSEYFDAQPLQDTASVHNAPLSGPISRKDELAPGSDHVTTRPLSGGHLYVSPDRNSAQSFSGKSFHELEDDILQSYSGSESQQQLDGVAVSGDDAAGHYPHVDPVLFPNYSVYSEPIKGEHVQSYTASQLSLEDRSVTTDTPNTHNAVPSASPTVSAPTAVAAGRSTDSVASGSRAKELGIGVESQYVRQLRRRSASVSSDVPASVWGLPIGISAGTSSILGTTRGFAKRGIDVKHTHLAPRLLDREVDDDDSSSSGYGINSNELAVTGMNIDNPGELLMSSSNIMGAGANMAKMSTSTLATTATLAARSKPTAGLAPSAAPVVAPVAVAPASVPTPIAPVAQANTSTSQLSQSTTRRSSDSSVESIDDGVGRIRLFVANPDSD